MLKCDKTDVFKGIDFNKTDGPCKCNICHYWYFLEANFKFQPEVCCCCHDLMQKAMTINDVTNVSVNWNYYGIHFWYMNKDEAINFLKKLI